MAIEPDGSNEGGEHAALLAQAGRLIHEGRAAAALELAEGFLASHPTRRAVVPLQLRAQLLLSLGRPVQAIAAYRDAVAAAPSDARLALGLAIACGEGGMPEAAEAAARDAISKGFDGPTPRFVLGRALFEQDRLDEAETEFRRVIATHPGHVAAHTSLAELVWMRTGDLKAACAAIGAGGGSQPTIELQMVRARLLHDAGASERAGAELAPLLRVHSHHVELHVLAAQCALASDPTDALALVEHALRLAPHHRPAKGLRGDILLVHGRVGEAAGLAESLLAQDPDDAHALALQAAAWRSLGDPRYRALYDYPRLVRSCRIDVPPGWPDLRTYLRDLSASLQVRHDRLQAHPPAQSARSGTQVELRLAGADAAVRAFPLAVEGPIRRYLEALKAGPNDAFSRRAAGGYRFTGLWSVRLRPHGHHANHYHGKGWISSACHLDVPASVSDGDRGGWLKFGEPGIPMALALPAEHYVKPEPGLLTLFPSWMWHGTVPFSGAPGEHRLSIAFDLVPAERQDQSD